MTENFHYIPKTDDLISVCIATYKRENLLENLLLSLVKQELPPNVKLEIVVTDNSPEGSARRILNKFTNYDNICYKYLIEPVKNISLARNKCVENASGEYICFIDDDETASESWIKNLYDALIKYNADAVFGYVETIFDKRIPSHFQLREFYFSPVGRTGTKALFYFTTNAIVKTKLIKSEKIPFDKTYGLTGGEDAHLFERLSKNGTIMINCREAISYEFIPPNRGTKRYLYIRSLRGGQSYARRKIEQHNNILVRMWILIKSLIMFFLSCLGYLLYTLSKSNKIKMIQIMGSSLGKIRAVFNMYRKLY